MPPEITIFVINLDRDSDRLKRMCREFDRVGLSFERLPGVYGTDLPPDLKPYFCDSGGAIVSTALRRGEIGCYASHLSAWSRIVERGEPAALICEDDLRLPDNMAGLLESIVSAAPRGWDVIRLSSFPKKSVSHVAPLADGYRLVRYWKIPTLTGAYMVSRKGAEKLLRPGVRSEAVDVEMSRPWLFGIDAYGVDPTPVIQNIDRSMIDLMDNRNHVRRNRTPLMRLRDKTRSFPHKVGRAWYNLRTMGPIKVISCLVENARHRDYKRRR
jgi:glycosyl transferase family 25